MENQGYTHLFWDFNGTIIDDLYACYQSENDLFEKYKLPKLASPEEYRQEFGFPVKDYYRRRGFDYSVLSYEALAVEWMDRYLLHAADAGLCRGVREALDYAEELGLEQWVLSASETEMLRRQLRDLSVLDRFAGILGRGDIHAGSKESLGIRWREEHPECFFSATPPTMPPPPPQWARTVC